MAELTDQLAAAVVAACIAGAEEAAGALGRAFDGEFVLRPGRSTTLVGAGAEAGVSGPGLVMLFRFGDESMAAVLPASSGLVPAWCASPDATGESKLGALAQELSMLLVPETLLADASEARWQGDLGKALARAGVGEGATMVAVEVARGEELAELRLVWPVPSPDELFVEPESLDAAAVAAPREEIAKPDVPVAHVIRKEQLPRDYQQLPPNTRNVLRVMVAVSARLAAKKASIGEIIELGPGSIITFDKSCDDDLELCVGDRRIALAEAVKVGEKFGVRVRQMILPDEQFRPLLSAR
ncbi:MAG: FliM/FliN family flagellar motor C-terminal domain-containing protein [Lacipirellulaceae bacterium]